MPKKPKPRRRKPLFDLPASPERRRLPPLLRRAWYGLNQSFRRRIAYLDITPDQYTILRWLSEGDPRGLTQRQIADLMAADPNTITSTLTRMEVVGFIARSVHETDRRAHRVRLTAAGQRKLEQAMPLALELQREVLSALSSDQLDNFLKNLETIAVATQCALNHTAE